MRELSVYYCPKCGYYKYYQLHSEAVCTKCSTIMLPLSLQYQEFINLGCKERDELLSRQIIESSSLVKRLMAPHKAANNRETIANLTRRIEELETENKKLNETVDWMHQTIWDLMRKYKNTD